MFQFDPSRLDDLSRRQLMTDMAKYCLGVTVLPAGFAAALGQGTSRGYCWMLEGNPTLRFYERSGARGNGKSLEAELGGKRVRELCLVWDPLPASLTDAGVGQDYPQG